MGGPPLSRTSSNDGSLRPENHKNMFTFDLRGRLEATEVTERLGLGLWRPPLKGHNQTLPGKIEPVGAFRSQTDMRA